MMDHSLREIQGLGPQRLEILEAAGIHTVRQLLCYLPVTYRDLTKFVPLCDLKAGDTAAVRVRITGIVQARYVKHLHITKAFVTDDTDTFNVIWYNQPWLKQNLWDGKELLLYGRAIKARSGLILSSPTIEKEACILPVYRSVGGIQSRTIRGFIQKALKICDGQWPDELPESIRLRYGLCERNFAMRAAHMPQSVEALEAARRRLSFEELLCWQVMLSLVRKSGQEGIAIHLPEGLDTQYWSSLSFPPTGAQRRVLCEIQEDLRSPRAMARMIQGDVGCGKTAVAFGALYLAAKGGYQGALMAPTEVLARQHLASARKVLEPLGIRCGLLTGSLGAKDRRSAYEAIAEGNWDVVIGTHALISQGVEYKNLGLVITDEQHRFGVRQRSALSSKGNSPNVLVMSATPIPRTLSLILYGDLDLSIIDELPPGRTPVATRIVPEDKREDLYGFIRSEVKKGRQVYIVCPLVEESEAVEAQPAEEMFEQLQKGPLHSLKLTLAHGKMKPKELEAALDAFAAGHSDVLVATTVIEVGVNVPNATVMVIENAERFGLAQLHQLRGRVGRGAQKSWCFLLGEANERLKLMTRTNDGFRIAEKDLELRGAGDLFGTRQSGEAMPGIQGMMLNSRILNETHSLAKELLRRPESEESRAVIGLAERVYKDRLADIAMN